MKQVSSEIIERAAITARLKGGLGNQLFIYGAAKALAESLRCQVLLDISWFQHQSLRQFELSEFQQTGRVLPYRDRLNWGYLTTRSLERRRTFSEKDFCYSPQIWQQPIGTVLSGYFQSWKYLAPAAREIRDGLTLREPSSWFIKTSIELESLGKWTSLHLRRGDYAIQSNVHVQGLLKRAYYDRAVSLCKNSSGGFPVVVFSDELEFAKSELKGISKDLIFITDPKGSRPAETMKLLSLADSAIIANSTFSWWAAWISDSPGKTVIAPDPWFLDPTKDPSDLIPDHWIKIPR